MERANICLRNSGQDGLRRGAIYTSQAVQDPVQPFIPAICTRGVPPAVAAGFNLGGLPTRGTNPGLGLARPAIFDFRPTRSGPPSILSFSHCVSIYRHRNKHSSCLEFALLRPHRTLRFCHYMMQPRGKNSITSCSPVDGQGGRSTPAGVCRPSRPAVMAYKANALPWGQ